MVSFVLLFQIRVFDDEFLHLFSEVLVAVFHYLRLLDLLLEHGLLVFKVISCAVELSL